MHGMIMASPALTSLIALLIASLLFALRYYRRAIHISPAFRRLTKPVFLPQSRIVDGKLFPLTLSPVDANAGAAARISLAGTFHAEILALVRTHGAVLLRGWDNKAQTAAHFSELMATLELPTTAMACSAGPRFAVAANVFTANEAPPEERIPFHHEMAQCDAPPSVVAFFCEVAAPHGGATPLLHSHLAAAYLRKHHPAVAARLKAVGVKYVRIMPPVTDPSSALGKSWRHSLRVETREQAEAALAALGSSWDWLPGEMLRTVTKPMAALLTETRGGREVFFTAAESTFNHLAAEAESTAAEAAAAPLRPLKAITYGDGAPLDAATKAALRDVAGFMERAQVAVPWQPGDALFIDNATVQHSRADFTPPRRILASLVGSLSKSKAGELREASDRTPKVCPVAISPSSTMDQINHAKLRALPSDNSFTL